MFDQDGARDIAERHLPEDASLDQAGVRELEQGWFFPYRYSKADGPMADMLRAGSPQGVIVNKHSGKALELGSGAQLQRVLSEYDQGYQFDAYDLVVLEVLDLERALDVLCEIRINIVEPEYSSEAVWRIPRLLTRDEIQSRLQSLPCVFGSVGLGPRIELLQEAARERYFKFEALEYRGLNPATPPVEV